jgi:hypothetical protein
MVVTGYTGLIFTEGRKVAIQSVSIFNQEELSIKKKKVR